MKNVIYFFFLCFLMSTQLAFSQWESVSSLPSTAEARHHPCTFSIGDFGYVVTGANRFGLLDDFLRYDPSSDTWQRMNDFPGGIRGFAIGMSHNSKGYVACGTDGPTVIGDLWEYDPESGLWKELADFPGEPRFHPALVAVNDKIYIGLGNNRASGNLNDWWEYDITNDTWEQKPNFPGARRHHPYQFSIGEYVYVGMGHGPAIYNDLYRYDPVTEEWTGMTRLPGEGRVAGTQFSYDGKGYVLSGQGSDHDYMEEGEFWEYDPETNSWTQLESHPGNGSRWAPGSFLIDGTVYFLAGEEANLDKSDMMKYQLKVISSNEELTSSSLTISPNPVVDNLNIAADYQGLLYDIVDLQGRKVTSGITTSAPLNVSGLPASSYVLRMYKGDQVITGPFIKN